MLNILSFLLTTVILCVCFFFLFRGLRYHVKLSTVLLEYLFILFYGLSYVLFAFITGGSEYSKAIDPADAQYAALSSKHVLTVVIFMLLFLCSAVAVWIKGRRLPPLALALGLAFLLIGAGISIAIFIQVSDDPTDSFPGFRGNGMTDMLFGGTYPVLNIIIAVVLIYRIVRQEAGVSANREYKNRFLNRLNKLIAQEPLNWAFIFLLPVFVIITLLLLLFGQETDSLVKVFTDTTTWEFSQ